MGKRGPAPKPTQLRLLHGDRKDRINTDEPIARDVLPSAPETMAPDVREIWDYTLRELAVMKLASAADRDALICYCEAVATHRKASEILAKSPVLVKGALNGLVRNPALAIQRDAANTIRALAQEFGLTPSARSGITVSKPKSERNSNPFSAAV